MKRIFLVRHPAAVPAALFVLLWGCASSAKAPDWVLEAPQEQDGYMLFVGAGDRETLAESEEAARLEVTEKILTFVGAQITARTDATVQATLDSFKADVTRTVEVKSEARLKSLELVEKWVDPDNDSAVWVLYRCETADLLAEQARLEALVREILSLVSTPEGEAEDLVDEGRFYDAALKYIQAASAASGLDIPNKDAKFERNVNAAKDALGKMTILPLEGDGMEAAAGKEMPSVFRAVVVDGARTSDTPVPDVSVKVSYRVMGSNGRLRTETVIAKSDKGGVVSFGLPLPRFVGAETVTVVLNAGPALETLEEAPDKYRSQIDSLEQLAVQKKATFRYTVISLARDVPMGIAVADLDVGRNVLTGSETAAGLLGELGAQRFRVRALRVPADRVVGVSDTDIQDYLATTFGSDVRRAVFGVSQITGTEKDGDRTVVRVRAVVKVADFDTGELRLSVEKTASGVATSPEAAAATAFRRAGELVAQEIAANLW